MRSITSFVRSTTLFAKGNLVLCPLKENGVSLWLNDVGRKRSNDVVSYGHKHKKKDTIFIVSFFLEASPGFEPGNNGFADRGLTAWLWHRILFAFQPVHYSRHFFVCQYLFTLFFMKHRLTAIWSTRYAPVKRCYAPWSEAPTFYFSSRRLAS